MARTDAGATLTELHRDEQLALRAATIEDFATLFPGWSLDDPGSFDDVASAGAVLASDRHRTSAGLAADYYERFRRAEGVGGEATPRLADRLDREEVRGLIRGAGLAGTVNARRRGEPMGSSMRNGLVKATGVLTKQVLAGGRDTLTGSLQADRQARGWQRVTAGDPCAFCVTLSSRGPAYRGQATAGFLAHSHCACTAEPSYDGTWNEQNRQHRDLYNQAQAEAREAGELARGTSNDALNAVRRKLTATSA